MAALIERSLVKKNNMKFSPKVWIRRRRKNIEKTRRKQAISVTGEVENNFVTNKQIQVLGLTQ